MKREKGWKSLRYRPKGEATLATAKENSEAAKTWGSELVGLFLISEGTLWKRALHWASAFFSETICGFEGTGNEEVKSLTTGPVVAELQIISAKVPRHSSSYGFGQVPRDEAEVENELR